MTSQDSPTPHQPDSPSTPTTTKPSEPVETQDKVGSARRYPKIVDLILKACSYFERNNSDVDKEAPIIYKEDKTGLLLLERKLEYASTMGNVCMTWWVSSLVFCGTIFAAVWVERVPLRAAGISWALGIFISLFFLGLVAFGVQIRVVYLRNIGKDLEGLPTYGGHKHVLSTELSTFRWSMNIGIFSFLFILIAWVYLFLKVFLYQ